MTTAMDERASENMTDSAESHLLDEALGILHRFALEQTGWRGLFRRWYYSDEPLRHDAANLVRRAGFETMRPTHTRLIPSRDFLSTSQGSGE